MPSGSTVFVDTNVLLYAVDPRDPAKQSAAQAWLRQCWQRDCGRISTQVLNELFVNLRRTAPSLSVDDARRIVREYRAWTPWVVDDDTADAAWVLQDRLGYHYWDALMLAAAQQQGCALLLSEDMQHNQVIDQMRIVNPFLADPSLLDSTP